MVQKITIPCPDQTSKLLIFPFNVLKLQILHRSYKLKNTTILDLKVVTTGKNFK